jgi:transcription elongation GreA/GreB family factor
MNKSDIVQRLKKSLQEKINELEKEIDSAKESRNSESKSSAGDKYETGREMIQAEINKQESQLSKTKQLLHDLFKLNLSKAPAISFGSLIKTDSTHYFISIPFGKLEIDGQTCYAISTASPLAKAMMGKKSGDTFLLNSETVQITNVS